MEHLMEQTAFTGYISLDNQELTDQMNLVQLFELVQFSQWMIVSITDGTLITLGSTKILQK